MFYKQDNSEKAGQGRKGYTLVEVMVAMTILSVGMLGLTTLQISGIRGNSLSGSNTEAGNLAKLHMESIINAEYDNPFIRDINKANNNNLKSVTNTDYRNVDLQGNPIDWDRYTLVWNVADDTPIKNTKTIVVMVTWKNGQRKRQIVHIKSLAS